MNMKRVLCATVAVLLATACSSQETPEYSNLSRLAKQGEKIFRKHKCQSCHATGVKVGDVVAPDLSRPFLANDSLFVQTHLRFVSESSMPDPHLTDREIRFISYYIAELHNAKLPKIPEEEIDTFDPVCYAPVSIDNATISRLHVDYLGKTYYFATEECMEAFMQAPEAFALLYEKFLEENQKL